MRTQPLLSRLLCFLLAVGVEFRRHAEGVTPDHCPDDQKSLLLELKSELLFDAALSTKLVNWNRSRESFEGVTCDNGHIVGLDLTNESISGGINGSSTLFRIQHIRRLNLAYNSFRYALIPSGMGNLTGLVYLNLSNAGFAGQIPMEISRLTRLVVLDLSSLWGIEFSSRLKIENSKGLRSLVGSLTELEELYMDGVDMSATGNEWCQVLSSSIPKLEVLSMTSCLLSGPIEPSLLKLSSLSVLRLSNNNFSTPFPEFISNFSGLTALNLFGCGLRGEVPGEIFQIQTLKDLVLSTNKMLGGSVPETMMNSSLQTLDLSYTNFSGPLPESIGRLTDLSRIQLYNCSFSGLIPSSMATLQQLTYLDLSRNNLTGPFPPFNNTSKLTYIVLSHNNLSGRIDSIDWRSISDLVHLDLTSNSLGGSIPSSLLSHPSLKVLELSRNSFSGPLEESLNTSSSQLQTLDLSLNHLQGPIPRAIFEIEGLVYLSLSSNNFSGSLHVNLFRQLKSLSHLDLSHNFLSVNATTAAVTGFPSLTTLSLVSCQLTTLPEFLASQSMLSSLDLSKNQIEGRIPRWIWKPDMLASLNLSHNMLEDLETPPSNLSWHLLSLDLHANKLQGDKLPMPPSVIYVDYSSNRFNSTIPPDIGKSLSLAVYFSLANNRFHGDIPGSICEAAFIQVLDLSNNDFTGGVPKCLTNDLLNLKVLKLRSNNLTGRIPDTSSETCGLRTIDLSGNRLQGQVPESLSNCKMIEVLDLGNNQLEDVFPCHLMSIPKLHVLVLKSNRFWGDINCPESNGNSTCETLQIIDLSGNSFGGTLPGNLISTWEAMKSNGNLTSLAYPFLELSGLFYQDTVTITFKDLQLDLVKILMVFTSIDFSSNKFEGPIPETLGTLKALKFLNLSRNAFSGQIPPSLGNLRQLESLDLSRNDLQGTIPVALSDLNFLEVLNLSYNRLEGSIPRTKQFLTFPESSYLGNKGLCGPPLEDPCSAAKEREGNGGKGDEEEWQDMRIFYLTMPFGWVVAFWGFFGLLMYFSGVFRRDFLLLLEPHDD